MEMLVYMMIRDDVTVKQVTWYYSDTSPLSSNPNIQWLS